MDGTGDYHDKRSKPDSEGQMTHVFSHVETRPVKQMYTFVYYIIYTCYNNIL
jgi:hypothetical protein